MRKGDGGERCTEGCGSAAVSSPVHGVCSDRSHGPAQPRSPHGQLCVTLPSVVFYIVLVAAGLMRWARG